MGFLILIIVIICIVAFLSSVKKPAPPAATPLELSEPTVAALAEEVVTVVNDMLEAGHCPMYLGVHDYDGLLMLHSFAYPPNFTATHITIRMVNSMNWQEYTDEARRKIHPKYHEWIDKAEAFTKKYGNCYDPSEKSYVYTTHCAVNLPAKNEVTRTKLMTLIKKQIKQTCPLADLPSSSEQPSTSFIMYTENVSH